MISDRARAGYDHLLGQALKTSLVAASGDHCAISILSDHAEIDETNIVVLTVSSYLFRAMVMLYFSPDDVTKAHFARKNNIEPADMDVQAFQDAIAECGNICCGILNRDLAEFFPHIGMSTPNVIDRNCTFYLQQLNCGHIQHFNVDLEHPDLSGQCLQFHATLCVCDYADIDFVVDLTEESADTGELEFF